MPVEFFSAVDKKRNPETGEQFISSETPIWYLKGPMRELEEDIKMTQRRLDSGQVPDRRRGEVKADLARMEKKLSKLKDSMPKKDEATIDACGKLEKELSKTLRDVLEPREMSKRKLVNVSRIADRMHTPCIPVSPFVAETAAANGMRVERGMVSQNDAQRLWKWARRFNDQDSRVEVLRRD